MVVCKFCGKDCKNQGGLAAHEPYCKKNPNRKKRKTSPFAHAPKGVITWNKGKTLNELLGEERANEVSNKIRQSLVGFAWKEHISEENNKKRIEKIKKTAAERHSIGGLRQGSGRGKKGWYRGYFCDSSWELAWVIYSLDHGIKFERNRESFGYSYRGKNKKFYPDFLLEDGMLVEIKGYETDEYRAKLKCFPRDRKIITLYKKDMKLYLDYAIDKFGKNFTKVYEKKKALSYQSVENSQS